MGNKETIIELEGDVADLAHSLRAVAIAAGYTDPNLNGLEKYVADLKAERDKYERDAIYHRVKVEELREDQHAVKSGRMLGVLLELLRVDVFAPEITLEEGGDLGLDYYHGSLDISIAPSGGVAWAWYNQESGEKGHGTNLDEFIKLLENFPTK